MCCAGARKTRRPKSQGRHRATHLQGIGGECSYAAGDQSSQKATPDRRKGAKKGGKAKVKLWARHDAAKGRKGKNSIKLETVFRAIARRNPDFDFSASLRLGSQGDIPRQLILFSGEDV